jgi:hypothetical protein
MVWASGSLPIAYREPAGGDPSRLAEFENFWAKAKLIPATSGDQDGAIGEFMGIYFVNIVCSMFVIWAAQRICCCGLLEDSFH